MVKDLCFEIIEKCPNNCRFCSSNSNIHKQKIISYTDFKRVIDYFVQQGGIEELSLSGGEPFLHPNIKEMICYAKSLGIRTVVFTSGIKRNQGISPEQIEQLQNEQEQKIKEVEENEPWNNRLKENIKKYYNQLINQTGFAPITKQELAYLKELGLDKIVFDFQAYEHETDEYLMGRDRKKHCCLLDSMLNAASVDITTDVHFIPMKPNYKEFPDILELLAIAGIKNISILRFVPQGRGNINKENLVLSPEELQEFLEIVERYKNKYNVNIRIGIPLLGENNHKCNAGLEKLDIKFDGTILPCPAFKELSPEIMKKFGIKHYSIYENLEEVKTLGGKRVEPLCQKVYKYN